VSTGAEQPFDEAIERTLEAVGLATGASRVYVFLYRSADGNPSLPPRGEPPIDVDAYVGDNSHEWCAAGVAPQISQLQGLPMSVFPWFGQETLAGRDIYLRELEDLPPEAAAEHELLAAQDITSLVVVPIAVRDGPRDSVLKTGPREIPTLGAPILGFLGVDGVGDRPPFPPTIVDVLRAAAGSVAAVLACRARERAQSEGLARLLRRASGTEATAALAAGIVHDLANLLVVADMQAEFLLERLPPGDDDRPGLEDVLALGQRGGKLLRRLLAAVTGRAERETRIDVDDSIRELGPRRRVTLALAAEGQQVKGPASAFDQAMLNLVLNARDATAEDGRIEISTRVDRVTHELVITVEDDGAGVAPEVRDRVFDPYVTTKGEQGSGLGLANVALAARELRGDVRLVEPESLDRRGARFELRLPPVPRDQPIATHLAGRLAEGQRRVLLVEDERALRVLIRRSLITAGFAVEDVLELSEAPGRLVAASPDVVVVDLAVGAPLVAALLDAVEAQTKPPIVVAMTSNPNGTPAREVEARGAFVLTKPFRRSALAEFVSR
jgi:signal transduction histidine kinase